MGKPPRTVANDNGTETTNPAETPNTVTFPDTDTPDKTWELPKLTAFVRIPGKLTLADRWRVGRALCLALALIKPKSRKQWLADNLPGWSESGVYRLKQLSFDFDNAEAVHESE